MSVDPALLSILRCPDEHHAELTLDEEAQTLTCTSCGRIYEIRDGIPVLLLDEAKLPEGKLPEGKLPEGKLPEAELPEGGAA